MEKTSLIIILSIIIIVVLAAINSENIFDYLRKIRKKGKKLIGPEETTRTRHDKTTEEEVGTFASFPDLIMKQLDDKGHTVYKHMINDEQMFENDVMFGLTVSRPTAETNGIRLYGKKKKDGNYDTKDGITYLACTVNHDAITIGKDKKGYYGEVTNNNAKVFVQNGENQTRIRYGELFDIKNGTTILVGEQWLQFEIPGPKSFPGLTSVKSSDVATATSQTSAGRKKIKSREI